VELSLLEFSSEKIGDIYYAMACNDGGKMVACAFSEDGEETAMKGVMKSLPASLRSNCQKTWPDPAKFRELHNLYMGNGEVEQNSCDLSHVSPFRQNVYRILRAVPRGRVTTYGAIAEKIGSRLHSRAVGTAVASNPLPLIVPCHRVVTASLEVVNYGMPNHKPSEGAGVKRGLLEREGVLFVEGKPSPDCLWL
jgi:methylated-DNA-[protein]-cysteine S-methyltransferase